MAMLGTTRARFHVVRINRWWAAAVAAVLLAAVAIAWGAAVRAVRVEPGVTLLGFDFSGLTEREARARLEELASAYRVLPVSASRFTDADGTPYAVPELNGYELDVDRTWLRLAAAPPNTAVEPAVRVQPAATRLADLPLSAIRQGNSEKQAVVLLINVDWGTDELRRMLPILKRKNARATFFLSGRWAADHPNLTRLIVAEGHEVATHGHDLTHGPKALAAAGRLKEDIQTSVAIIEELTGQKVKYYAPHKSEVDQRILQTAAELNLQTVLYSLDTVDWNVQYATPERILATFQKAKSGDLILMHPKENTVQVLEQAIDLLRSRGYQVVTLSEMLSPEPLLPGQSDGQVDGE
jgi:peptidoglycan/xylan/chitin deacetylase (PgdA/CDA1 family)